MTSDTVGNPLEMLSALFDDELEGEERDRAIRIAQRSPVARRALRELDEVDAALRDWFSEADSDAVAAALNARRFGSSALRPATTHTTTTTAATAGDTAGASAEAAHSEADAGSPLRLVLPAAPRLPRLPRGLGRWIAAAALVFLCSTWAATSWRRHASAEAADAALLAAAAVEGEIVSSATAGEASPFAALASRVPWGGGLDGAKRLELADTEVWEASVEDDFGSLALFATRTSDRSGDLRCDVSDDRERCAWSRQGWRFLATAPPSDLGLATRLALGRRGFLL